MVDVAGKQAEEMVELIHSQKHVNEFLIAKKLDLTVNQVRNMLYKLSDRGIVSYIRKKDKRKGWFTYFWRMEVLKSLEALKGSIEKKLAQTNNQISSREKKIFYVCKNCSIEFTEENALVYNFTCTECGNIFEVQDNTKLIKEMKKNSARFEKELSFVNKEISEEKGKIDKEKERKRKKSEKEQKQKRAIKKLSRKTAKAAIKKTVKKEKRKKHSKKLKEKKKIKKKVVKKTIRKKVKKPVKKKGKSRKK